MEIALPLNIATDGLTDDGGFASSDAPVIAIVESTSIATTTRSSTVVWPMTATTMATVMAILRVCSVDVLPELT
jgi:hypothetical protein